MTITLAFELVTALFVLITAIIGWRVKSKMERANTQLQEVHILVNDRADRQEKRIDQLILALTEAGVRVPPTRRTGGEGGDPDGGG